ncbi:NAD-dependent protein deacetylase hst2-1 [Endocarpon pusillum Z07020]|uniref:NAD-dependent protein deacetylase hst2-1 n=1 Tax=Endocarpon pusillum (strain Z07020 / HMAS-L-300199) TaxID=1263415 RepID=U1GBK0_ENDPU|nr:NAD-dependent protein deacetylase hst2-1 [Endocarpon pusillum Z07020]ERF74932.1 NAD-dependent protein deacetylase hst2-1 [Endocarpon pusillum Z07020]
MGNESSVPVEDDVPPQTLESRTLESVAKYITERKVRRIVVMTGAGISTAAGIPDFRSPDTGLYANLARLNLPYAEAVFDISYFRNNPLPFYTLAHELYPGRYRPTVTHCFMKLLYDKGLLLKLFTQNIDCLEREAGVPGEMIVEAHGSFASQRCIECKTEFPDTMMKKAVQEREVPRCLRKTCNGLVKPDIVFFGEALPEAFHRNRTLPAAADLAIIMGTSLSVQPFASLPSYVREETPRILINLERVGGLGSRADDVLLLGECDAGVRKLADALGWLDELEDLWQRTTPSEHDQKEHQLPLKTRDEKLEEEVDQLTRDIDQTLKLSKDHHSWLGNHLKDNQQPGKKASVPLESALSVPLETSADAEPERHGQDKPSINTCDKRGPEGTYANTSKELSDENNTADLESKEDGNLSHVFPHIDTTREKSSL